MMTFVSLRRWFWRWCECQVRSQWRRRLIWRSPLLCPFGYGRTPCRSVATTIQVHFGSSCVSAAFLLSPEKEKEGYNDPNPMKNSPLPLIAKCRDDELAVARVEGRAAGLIAHIYSFFSRVLLPLAGCGVIGGHGNNYFGGPHLRHLLRNLQIMQSSHMKKMVEMI